MNRIIKISIFIFVFNIIFSEEYAGYLREIDMSFCMDDCSHFYLESEEGEYISNISFNASFTPDSYINRYIYIEGEEIWCVECGAIEVEGVISYSPFCSNLAFCISEKVIGAQPIAKIIIESINRIPKLTKIISEWVSGFFHGCIPR